MLPVHRANKNAQRFSRLARETYLEFCWFSGDGASCLNTVNDGRESRASLQTDFRTIIIPLLHFGETFQNATSYGIRKYRIS